MSESTTLNQSSSILQSARQESSLPTALNVGRWAAVDQVIFSAANFFTAVILGRFGGSHELGQYAVALAVIHLVTATQRALASSPYTYLKMHTKGRRRGFSRGSALFLSASLSGTAALLVVLGAFATARTDCFVIGSVCAFTLLCWGLRDTCRRVMFADHAFREATLFDSVVVLLQMTFLLAILQSSQLTATTVLLSIAAACGLVTVCWLVFRRGLFKFHRRVAFRDLEASWKFGRWGALSEFVFALQDMGVQAILALCAGLSATGIYAAGMSLVRLANPLVHAVSNAVGPLSARALQSGGVPQLSAGIWRVTKLMAAAMTAYVLCILLGGRTGLALLYGEEYQAYASILIPLSISSALVALALAPSKAISALRMPRLNFWANLTSLVATLSFALLSFEIFDVYGVALSVLAGAMIAAAMKWWFYFQLVRSSN